MKKIIWIHPRHLDIKKMAGKKFRKFLSKILFIDEKKIKLIHDKISSAEILINCPTKLFNRKLIKKSKKLKWIHFGGAGVEKILIKELINSKIILTNGFGKQI